MNEKNNQNEQWKLLVLLLKEIAESKGITQNQIGEIAEMHQSHVSRFFALKFPPNLNTFLKIAKSIKVNFFFEDKEDKTDLTKVFEKAMTELGRRPDNLPKN